MDFRIANEVPGRVRVLLAGRIPSEDVDAFYKVLYECPLTAKASVYPRIGSLAISYAGGEGHREAVLAYLAALDTAAIDKARASYTLSLAPKAQNLLMDIAVLAGSYVARRWFVPWPVRAALTLWQFRRFLSSGLRSLAESRLDVSVLDASAVAASLLQGDVTTAGQTMFLLDLGGTFETYTKRRSENEFINSLLEIPEYVQKLVSAPTSTSTPALTPATSKEAVPANEAAPAGSSTLALSSASPSTEELTVLATDLAVGDRVVVRTGMPICIDGTIERGTAMVNQAALTGESVAIERLAGDDVFAGTTVEDGEIVIRVRHSAQETKLRSIVSLVKHFDDSKSESQSRMGAMANKLVPWNFLLAGVVGLVTRSVTKASAALMVDYSCALKLTGSIAVLSAMNQSAQLGFTVKGSKYFDEFAKADTLVFDKTGTLTNAVPEVAGIIALEGWDEREVLRLAACLEEHFPHPVARAVIRAAAQRHITHRERHAEVGYIVAHGIVSSIEGKRVVIGSEHFIVEDEKIEVPRWARQKIAQITDGHSLLFLGVNGELVGVLAIEDPIKSHAAAHIQQLRELGFKRVVMLTGDTKRSASKIAEQAGVDEYQADLLPEDKQAYLRELKAQGCRVVMVGDGINDSPALSLADVGVAMGQGTAVAKEVADITLMGGDLGALVTMRRLSVALMQRLDTAYRGVMGFNSLLLALGITGIITPTASSLLHNGSTIGFSLASSRAYLLDEDQ
ncbi:MAG: heavy metal translocating P-type ATPase [Coriobacteriales bacterium]|jgi:heavy metal translocating P-type ATPase|nr:heavy metal translocating P-type ATPase [Coriobacteriales bacterium]